MRSLQTKLLLYYIPLMTLSAVALLIVQEMHSYAQQHAALVENLNQTADVQQQALAVGLWEYDREATRRLVEETGKLPFIHGVRVFDAFGEEVARAGDGSTPEDPALFVVRPIVHKDQFTEERVGRLILSAHDRVVRAAIKHNLKTQALLVAVMMLVLISVTWVVTRRLILEPLQQLRESIQEVDRRNRWHPVRWESRDEIGQVVSAYNALQESRIRMERQLKEQAEAIEEERNRFQLAVDGTNDGLWDWNMQTNRMVYSPRLATMLGYQAGELPETLEAWSELIHPDDLEEVWRVTNDYLATRGKGTYQNTLRMRTKLGQWRWITARGKALFDHAGKPVRFVGFNTDIENRKKTEDSLRKLSRAVEQSHGTILITDLEPRIEFVNPAFTRITGYQPEEALGHNPSILKSGMHDAAFYRDMWDTLLAGEVWTGELLNRSKEGRLFWEYSTISPVKNEEGEITHYVAIKEDITSRKEAEEELIAAKKAAESANHAKSAFLANMSHELRTPLNAISGFAQLLKHSPKMPDELQDHVNRILRGGDYLLTLINDILDLSKVEVGRIELHPENLDLFNFLREINEMIQLRAEQKGILFHYRAAPSLPSQIQADPKRLRQILLNLLGNAVKFTDQGEVTLDARYQQGLLMLDVRDTGPGISQQDLARIFEPFVQSGDNKYRSQGTGLGLSITRGIVELMEGDIQVHSDPGGGAHFQLRLPLEKSDERLSNDPGTDTENRPNPEDLAGYRLTRPLASGEADRPLRLMVVDDIASNRIMLTYFLEPLGFEVEEASDGEACVRQALKFLPDLVLMDMRMPGLNGLETMNALHAIPAMRDLPVVIVSASVFHEDSASALQQGATAYLHKPVELGKLLATLKALLPIEWELVQRHSDTGLHQTEAAQQYPVEWLKEMAQAIAMGNAKQLRNLLEQLKQQGIFVPAILRTWVDSFDYDHLLAWIEQQLPADDERPLGQ